MPSEDGEQGKGNDALWFRSHPPMPPSQAYSVSHSELQRNSTSSEEGVAHPRASSPMSNTVEPPPQQGTVDRKQAGSQRKTPAL